MKMLITNSVDSSLAWRRLEARRAAKARREAVKVYAIGFAVIAAVIAIYALVGTFE